MDIPPFYLTVSAAWTTIQALPLLFTPKLILALFNPENQHTTSTEAYLARLLALCLFTLSLICFFVPAQYTSLLLTFFHVSTFIAIYTTYTFSTTFVPTYTPTGSLTSTTPNTTGLILGLIGYGILSAIGIWVLVFGTVPSHLSKRTGADKRTSGFPFGNRGAYDKKKDYAAVGQTKRH